MKVSDFVIKCLTEYGATDAFGIPGGVILPFLYALDASKIRPHLTYHEQTAAFAACGYAQASGKLGVAYATRGPGISNMFTAVAEAYQESLPVIFITAHGSREDTARTRFVSNQELDVVHSVSNITKYAVNIDAITDVVKCFRRACLEATSGRKGPVLVDFSSQLWNKDIVEKEKGNVETEHNKADVIIREIGERIKAAARPVFLIGDGLRNLTDKDALLKIADRLGVPILSSKGTQDLLSGSSFYYGYIGSHGIRYSNFILSKADLIVAVGNRMAFPRSSKSFAPILKNKKIIKIDIDEGELLNSIPGETSYLANAKDLIEELKKDCGCIKKKEWIEVCDSLKNELLNEDCTKPVMEITECIEKQEDVIYVCDVGNNEFWFSRAYEKCGCTDMILASKSFGTLGSAIGKAIGAYYAKRKKVICVVGDQGLQYNIQELQYIKQHELPIDILLLNNQCSGMIADHEGNRFDGKLLHVNKDTGYSCPDFKAVFTAYGIEDRLIELDIEEGEKLIPSLPKGNPCQDMEPALDKEKYEKLNAL